MSDVIYMQRCLELAKKGAGHVAPNPKVGSVIVHDQKIIGEAYHIKYGEAHAEVNAIKSVTDKSLLNKSTIYINLEPCAHFGKTPPCADLIIKHKIKKVVIGCIDSFSEVAGKGIERIKKAGIEVVVGVLEQESLELNKRFFTFHTKKRPYIILKWAQTKDGFIDKYREEGDLGINWITQKETKQLVHKWRHEEAAILVGKNTVINDNPTLTCRDYPGSNPIRIIIDPKKEIDLSKFKVSSEDAKTVVLSGDSLSALNIMDELYQLNIQSVIIEGGAFTINTFLEAQLWDEARVIEGASLFGNGLVAPKIKASEPKISVLGKDKLYTYFQ
jgi:diaminohydroxyphosphoribosylaminopyrimidine deaminase/5-amino-6-(5-phosphoribosylamino)uracil reductase